VAIQQRFAEEGADGLLRDKTRKPDKPPVAAETVARVVGTLTSSAEAGPGSDQSLDPPVILLDDGVQVFAPPQPREAPQVTSSLHVGHRTAGRPRSCPR